MDLSDLFGAGLFITVDGADGCGKSTMLTNASMRLVAQGIPHRIINCPDVTSGEGEEVRKFILSRNTLLSPSTEAYLFVSGFHRALEKYIVPSILRNDIIFVDRWWYTTMVYQGIIRGKMPLIKSLIPTVYAGHVISETDIKAREINFLLSVDAKTSQARRSTRSEGDVYDRQSEDFHRQVTEGYLSLFRDEDVISGVGSPEEVTDDFLKRVIHLAKLHKRVSGRT